MRRRLAAAFLASLALAASGASATAMKGQRPPRSTELPRPRDGDAAVREELDGARRAGTLVAYNMFLSRHGDHALAETARRERTALVAGKPRR